MEWKFLCINFLFLFAVCGDELEQLYDIFVSTVPLGSAHKYDIINILSFYLFYFFSVLSGRKFHEIMIESPITPEWKHRPDLINLSFRVYFPFTISFPRDMLTVLKVMDKDQDDFITLEECCIGLSNLCRGALAERFTCTFLTSNSPRFNCYLQFVLICTIPIETEI